jgi:hypothetical protein
MGSHHRLFNDHPVQKTEQQNWGRQGKTAGEKEKPYATDFASRTSDYLNEREIS